MRTPFVALVIVGLAVACSGGSDNRHGNPNETAGDALQRQLDFISRGEYGLQWEELYPGQQALVPRTKFIECMSKQPFTVNSLTVLETQDAFINDLGVNEDNATKVSVQIDSSAGTGKISYYEVRVKDGWRWILDRPAVEAYEQKRCPA